MSTVEKPKRSYREIAAYHKLRVNVKSITAEMKIIRHEEKVCKDDHVHANLVDHRKHYLRRISRYAHLALAAAKGRRYSEVETKVIAGNEVSAYELNSKFKKHGIDIDCNEWLKS